MESNPNYPLIIAHRGASALAPENTFAAFRRAIEDGAEGIEFDVRLTKDRVPVIFHDSTLKRICGIKKKVSKVSFEELKSLDAGSWFNERSRLLTNERFSQERIPSLNELLSFLDDFPGKIYIELKAKESNINAISDSVCAEIISSKLLSQIIVKSFNLDVVARIRKVCPDVKVAALFAPKVKTILRKDKRLINVANDIKADRLSLHFSLASRKLLKRAAKNGLPVTIWTANNPRWISRAIQLGIDHIITNNPARLLETRRQLLENEEIPA